MLVITYICNLYNKFISNMFSLYNLYKWFDCLLPMYFQNFWKQQKKVQTNVYIVVIFFSKIYTKSIQILIFFCYLVFILLVFKILYYTRLGRFLISISGGYFFLPQIRFYIYIFLYTFLFLLNIYILWSFHDLYISLDKCKIILEYYKLTNIWKILYADYTPYNIFENDNRFTFGRRFFKLGVYRCSGIHLHAPLAEIQFINSYIYKLNAYFIVIVIFLTIIHIIKMLKHLFEDYLRDLDKDMMLFYYYIFCLLCVFLFFTNSEQLLIYFINFFSADNLIFFICIYLFIFIFYFIILFYTYIIVNKNKKVILINFIFYFIILFVVWYWYSIFSAYLNDKFFELYFHFKAFLTGNASQYLLFYENTQQYADTYLSPVNTKKRVLFF